MSIARTCQPRASRRALLRAKLTLLLAFAALGASGAGACASILGVDSDYVLGDAGPCAHCDDRRSSPASQDPLCESSQALFDDLASCVCQEQCVIECANDACKLAASVGNTCVNCIVAKCDAELNACTADKGPDS